MKISAAILTLSFALFANAASQAGAPGDGPARCSSEHDARGNYNGHFSKSCVKLVDDCLETLNTTQSANIWGVSTCVAAATCDGTINLLTLGECQNDAIRDDGSTPSLDYDLYSDIVGNCAWKKDGCPMTRQNYIDFVFGSLSSINSDVFPKEERAISWWDAMVEWTKTGETIPYQNFNDWLHFSHSQ